METLMEARAFLRENFDNGAHCPCCTQFVKMYKRKITSSMIIALCYIQQSGNRDFFHIEDYLKSINCRSSIRGDFSKLRFFGLIEKFEGKRDDGSSRNGHYKITQMGLGFLNGKVSVPRYVNIFNDKVYGYSDHKIFVGDAFKEKFKYDELMKSTI